MKHPIFDFFSSLLQTYLHTLKPDDKATPSIGTKLFDEKNNYLFVIEIPPLPEDWNLSMKLVISTPFLQMSQFHPVTS
jgi:hypothetical protein